MRTQIHCTGRDCPMSDKYIIQKLDDETPSSGRWFDSQEYVVPDEDFDLERFLNTLNLVRYAGQARVVKVVMELDSRK